MAAVLCDHWNLWLTCGSQMEEVHVPLLSNPSLASQTFARKTGRSGDISIAVAVPVEHTECNFSCIINLNSCACRFINIALQQFSRIYIMDRKH